MVYINLYNFVSYDINNNKSKGIYSV